MERKYQYLMMTVAVIVLAVWGVFALRSTQVQADTTSEMVGQNVVAATAVESTHAPLLAVQEAEDGVAKVSFAPVADERTEASEPALPELPTATAVAENSISTEEAEEIGSLEAVENDGIKISAVLYAFADQQEKHLFNEPGWLHVRAEYYVPTTLRGSGSPQMPMSELFPEDLSFMEDWYHVDETGRVSESLHYNRSSDNIIRQVAIFTGSKMVNLTAKAAGLNPQQYEWEQGSLEIHQLTRSYAEMFESMATWPGEFEARLDENGLYTVSFTEHHPEGLEDFRFTEPILSSTTVYTFDPATGFFVSFEGKSLVANEWITRERKEYTVMALVPEMPEDVADLFAQSLADAQE